MTAYYNEFDPKAAAWLRQLIENGNIADGIVDERSITEVTANDIDGFSQHHFFAGIGVWSYALRNAGWPDDRPVCTASLPCQPFSAAGSQKGKDDERHLLPHFLELVKQYRPNTIFGEQVPGAIKHGWLDDLYDEMERENYAVGSTVLTAAGAGKAHIRQRIFWVANSSSQGLQGHGGSGQVNDTQGREKSMRLSAESGLDSGMGYTEHDGHFASKEQRSNDAPIQDSQTGTNSTSKFEGAGSSGAISESIEWVYCRDEKFRPIKEGINPLVRTVKSSVTKMANGAVGGMVHSRDSIITPNDSAEARATRVKGYGNAIVAPVATEFIKAFMSINNNQGE